MATTTANKHGLRKAAAERTNRHAQRTPLPPRPGQVEDAREVIAAAAEMAGDQTDVRSWGKAQAFQALAVAAKWSVSVETVGGAVELTARRDAETIVQAWSGGVWQYDASFYGYGDRTTKPRNASGASKLLTRTPDEAATEASKVASNRHFRKSEPKDITTRLEDAKRVLPFDPELSPDDLILGTLTGQAILWYNRLSRGTERAMVGRKGGWITKTPDGQRVVTFCCPATGYRSCLVSAILKVGRGRVATNKGADVASVELDGE